MVAALVSELTGRPVRGDLAMTGEITLSGNVLPVGGIKEKVLAARRLGIVEVVLPRQNEKHVNEDLSEDLRREIDVHYVSMIDECSTWRCCPPRRRRPGRRIRPQPRGYTRPSSRSRAAATRAQAQRRLHVGHRFSATIRRASPNVKNPRFEHLVGVERESGHGGEPGQPVEGHHLVAVPGRRIERADPLHRLRRPAGLFLALASRRRLRVLARSTFPAGNSQIQRSMA